MKLITEVDIPPLKNTITYNDKMLFVGSCFAENIGAKFLENKFNGSVNPYGVLYNPMSVLQMLKHASGSVQWNPEDLVQHNGLWHSFAHHGSFSKMEKEEVVQSVEKQQKDLKIHFSESTYLFITWGTAWVYRYLESRRIVANCHKIPTKAFERNRLTVNEIVEQYEAWISEIQTSHPNLNIVLTVSPVRHLKDTAHGNQVSKSVLLLAAEQLCQQFDHVHYFPSYEIVLDELRDYRFYASDMTHPNGLAIEYIWEKITQNWMDKSTIQMMVQIQTLVKAASHRPFKTTTPEHQKFVQSTLKKIEKLCAENPYLIFTQEIQTLTKQLK